VRGSRELFCLPVYVALYIEVRSLGEMQQCWQHSALSRLLGNLYGNMYKGAIAVSCRRGELDPDRAIPGVEQRSGASYIVFTMSTFWRIDQYGGFHHYLHLFEIPLYAAA
jgi:hypothetical protein